MSRYSAVPSGQAQSPVTSVRHPSMLSETRVDTEEPTSLHLSSDYGRLHLGVRSKVLLPTLLVFIMTAGLGITVTAWLLAKNKIPMNKAFTAGYFLADEGTKEKDGVHSATLSALTATSFIATFISVTSPILMLLISYYIAHMWVKAQACPSGNSGSVNTGPTPLQYGLLIDILNSPSFMSLGKAVYYLTRRNIRVPAPQYLKEAVILGVLVYLISHLVGLADLWLHATTAAVLYNMPLSNPGPPVVADLNFSETVCDTPGVRGQICGSEPDYWGFGMERQFLTLTGIQVVSNSSTDRRVISLADASDLAIVIPASFDEDTSFAAPSFGVRTQCKALCTKDSGCVRKGLSINCSSIGITIIPSNDTSFTNVVYIKSYNAWNKPPSDLTNGAPVMGNNSGTTTNPAESLIQLRWPMRNNLHFGDTANEATMGPYGRVQVYALCNITVYNLTVSYDGGAQNGKRWGLVPNSEVLSTPFFTSSILAPYNWNLVTDQIAMNMRSRALTSNTTEAVMAALGQEVSRLSLAMVSGIFYFTPTSNVEFFKPTILGRYPLAPLFTFVLLLVSYGLIALIIFFMTLRMRSGTVIVPRDLQDPKLEGQPQSGQASTLELVQVWLTSPIPALRQAFAQPIDPSKQAGPDDPDARSVSLSISEMLHENISSEGAKNRLRFGIEDTGIRPRFGVWSNRVVKEDA
ncbi:Multidrug resistance protein MdtC [Rhizoctonia solani]|uniref:Multidrug resistance protein MdtC n=1 Tax=Rhizoctonia solani TaxID=456999 RepID=A0A0K6FXJ8_9AGAM|nr:Multidrug resistance protein MdtC [Rhizoctonia solani]